MVTKKKQTNEKKTNEQPQDKISDFLNKLKQEGKKFSQYTSLELKVLSLSYKKEKKIKELGKYVYQQCQNKIKNFTKDKELATLLLNISTIEKEINKIRKKIDSLKK